MLMLYSIFVYPNLQKKWGRTNCCQAGLLASACAALIFPTAHFVADCSWLAQVLMFIAVGIRSMAKVPSLSSSPIIVKTVAPSRQIGSVNGAGQTIGAFARSVGPLIAGLVWGACVDSDLAGKQFLPFIGSVVALCLTVSLYRRLQLPG